MIRLKIIIFSIKDYLTNEKKHDEKMMIIYFFMDYFPIP